MKSVIIMSVAGVGLFSSTVVGLLALQGRLNFEGTRGLPVVSMLFEEPPADPDAEHEESHDDGAHHAVEPTEQPRLEGLGREAEVPHQLGPSVPTASESGTPHGRPEHPEQHGAAGDDHGAGGHGDDGHETGHGNTGHAEASHDNAGHEDAAHAAPPGGAHNTHGEERHHEEPSSEHRYAKESLMGQAQYRRGQLFAFPRIQSGMGVEDINELLASARGLQEDLKRERAVLDQRETSLAAREADLQQREAAVLTKMREVLQARRELEDEVTEFQKTYTLVRQQEIAQFQSWAEQLATLSTEKSSEIIRKMWQRGDKTRAVKILKMMPDEARTEIFGTLSADDAQEILELFASAVAEEAGG